MDPHDGAVDHLQLAVMSRRQGIHQAVPDTGLAPAIEAIVRRRIGAIALGQISPWRTCRSTQKMPFITRRSFFRLGPGHPRGSTGSMIIHSASVRSYRTIKAPGFGSLNHDPPQGATFN
jgi:hypothetical protein